jgi:DNA-binding PadR family transcriptional regulator
MPEGWPFPIPGLSTPGSPESRGRQRFFALGEVRLIILSLLDEAPSHGYQLMKQLGERLGELYRSSAGTVYPALKQLQKEGLIESNLKEGRYIYRLTKEGRKTVRVEANWIQQIWSRASNYHGLGKQLGPQSAVVASPLQEVIAAGLTAARWSSGNADREDRVRSILRNAASQLRSLVHEGKHEHTESV